MCLEFLWHSTKQKLKNLCAEKFKSLRRIKKNGNQTFADCGWCSLEDGLSSDWYHSNIGSLIDDHII